MKTRDQLITDALEKIGALGVNETATANQITRAASVLTSLLNFLRVKGMPQWKLKQYTYAMSLFTAGYAKMGVGQTLVSTTLPLKMLSAQRYDALALTTIDLNVYTRQEYFVIPSTSITSVPTQVYVQPQKTYLDVYLWPLPDTYWTTNGSLKIDVQEATTDVTVGTDLPDFPVEWEDPIIYLLASRLAPNYGVPVQERNLLAQEAERILQEVLGFGNEEGSLYINPKVKR